MNPHRPLVGLRFRRFWCNPRGLDAATTSTASARLLEAFRRLSPYRYQIQRQIIGYASSTYHKAFMYISNYGAKYCRVSCGYPPRERGFGRRLGLIVALSNAKVSLTKVRVLKLQKFLNNASHPSRGQVILLANKDRTCETF